MKMTAETTTAPSPGNTKPGSIRARHFQLTLNEIDKYNDLKTYLTTLKTNNYFISCEELAPTTGHKHIHIYAQFTQTIKLSIKKTCGAHIEICRGTPQQNYEYITKDGNIIDEIGTMRKTGNIKTCEDLKEIEISECPPNYYNIKKRIDEEENDKNIFFDMLDEIKNDNLKGPEIIYIKGDTGKGKTYKAYKIALEKYEKEDIGKLTLKNDFIDVINKTAKCFVIEEFRPSQIKASDFLQLTDKYGYRCNIKGGFHTLRPEMIIICSIIEPENIYHEEVNKQFLRRITQIINLGYEEKDNFIFSSI